jgi:hypothetical protein
MKRFNIKATNGGDTYLVAKNLTHDQALNKLQRLEAYREVCEQRADDASVITFRMEVVNHG